MAFNLNRVMIAGNLTRDPDVKTFAGEKTVAQFALAINHKYKAADGTAKEDTVFVDVEAWGRTAELVGQYLTKGRGAYVEGRLKLDRWETADGEKRQRLKVVAESVQFTSPKREGDSAGSPSPVSQPQRAAVPAGAATDDEPPF